MRLEITSFVLSCHYCFETFWLTALWLHVMENAFTSFIFEFENSLLEFFIRLFVEIFHPVSLLGILLTAHVLQLQLQSRSLRLQVYHLKSTSNCLTLFSIQRYLSCTGTCTCTCGVGTCTVLVPEVLVLVVSVLVLVLVPEVLVLVVLVLVLYLYLYLYQRYWYCYLWCLY